MQQPGPQQRVRARRRWPAVSGAVLAIAVVGAAPFVVTHLSRQTTVSALPTPVPTAASGSASPGPAESETPSPPSSAPTSSEPTPSATPSDPAPDVVSWADL